MKLRQGFVSNSSSSSFLITNTSKEVKTLVDFVKENAHLLDAFKRQYDWYKENEAFSLEAMIKDAGSGAYCETFKPGEQKPATFGDEDGTILGHVYDYILREGGKSASFEWSFWESNR